MRPLIDAHLDLAWSALSFNRDLTLELEVVRESEKGMSDVPGRGKNTVTFPELRRAGVKVCVGTLLARGGPEQKRQEGYKRTDLDYVNQTHAYAVARGQLAYYEAMEEQGVLSIIRTGPELEKHWASGGANGMGMILSMEGADPIMNPWQVREWWDAGLRAVGPVHYGRGCYGFGTGVEGPLGSRGRDLMAAFERAGMILDVTHLCDEGMAEALDYFGGRVLASHHNCRALVPGDRQLSDEQIKKLAGRGAVIGAALVAWMLYPGWVRGETLPAVVGLAAVADHIERVCDVAGDVLHAGIGSDLDGGFGTEQTPHDVGTIADLQKLGEILAERRFDDTEIDLVFWGNWLRFFREALPAG